MEISVELRREILSVQAKLRNSIREHQICSIKLKGDPEKQELHERLKRIQQEIISLGKWQKVVFGQMRREMNKENAPNGAKTSLLLGLNNNVEITKRPLPSIGGLKNGEISPRRQSKNGDTENEQSSWSSPTSMENEPMGVCASTKERFLGYLGLQTLEEHNRRNNVELAEVKRRRIAFLQSQCSAPRTRQTTARLNGPSPPPSKTSSGSSSRSSSCSKSTNSARGLANRHQVVRNGEQSLAQQQQQQHRDSRKLPGEPKSAKSKSKSLQIPGLPSGLTIERIEDDSAQVCITCKNPGEPAISVGLSAHWCGGTVIDRTSVGKNNIEGTLTVCESCSSKFHISCHTIAPASHTYCPRCAANFITGVNTINLDFLRQGLKGIKKDQESGAGAYAQATRRPSSEEQEPHKQSTAVREADSSSRPQLLSAITKLPASTILIPFAGAADANATPSSTRAANESLGTAASRLIAEQQKKQSKQQSSILLNKLRQPNLNLGQSILLVPDKDSGKSLRKRGWNTNRSNRAVSLLNKSVTDRLKSQQSSLTIGKSTGNYVTVEVICTENADSSREDRENENSSDCVYVTEKSKGMPDLIDLEPSKTERKQIEEHEVLNVSSGSSGLQVADSPRGPSPSASEQQDTRSESGESSKEQETAGPDVDSVTHFLEQIFPGRYGYKIDVVELDSSCESSSRSSSPSCDDLKLEDESTSPQPEPVEVPDNDADDDPSDDHQPTER